MRHGWLIAVALMLSTASVSNAQKVPDRNDMKAMGDSLKVLMEERTSVQGKPVITRIQKRGNLLDFHFDPGLGCYPWKDGDIKWLRARLGELLPEDSRQFLVGNIYSGGLALEEYITPVMTGNGQAAPYRYMHKVPRRDFVTRSGSMRFKKGLSGRHIALWQSHGRYYNAKAERWEWQRAPLFTTVEDMYTQSYVLPFLIPMLENAGAYVMTPRERDTQPVEFIIDNDLSFSGERDSLTRKCGTYHESGRWTDAGTGFADTAKYYPAGVNPFTLGTARMTACTDRKGSRAEIRWTPYITDRDRFAVYVSYKSLPNSTGCARYTVHHLGGETSFCVDQRMGGGTWIYLGTFEFGEGSGGWVSLDNTAAAGHSIEAGTVVTADAVKIGGGMGKIARGPDGGTDAPGLETSGMPAYAEGAYYWMQWAGVDSTLTHQWEGDYYRDYASRGAWTRMLKEEKGIPIDMSLAIHSDAGIRQLDSTVGTLAIYTLKCEGSRKFKDGTDRMCCRGLADLVQEQVCNDIRAAYGISWNRREMWNRSYSESRTTGVPALLLEMLSHQNFNDMKYGLDPTFRFTVSRAIYKGSLKFLSNLYGEPYAVQPLPVQSFAVSFASAQQKATLSWEATEDPLEPTARPTGYILYTRIDDGVFDEGVVLKDIRYENGRVITDRDIAKGHLYSFRIAAYNDGGLSFPSETLCIGAPTGGNGRRIMVVNNFYRISGPAWFDSEKYAGFNCDTDPGVPYMTGIEYVGDNFEYCRERQYVSDSYPGFGATHTDGACRRIAGNTFDFVKIHARALMDLGYEVFSTGRDAWAHNFSFSESAFATDILCGRQVSTITGSTSEECRYRVFPRELRKVMEEYADAGGHIIISGTDIATDVWSSVYPVIRAKDESEDEQAFVRRVLGYTWRSGFGSSDGSLKKFRNRIWSVNGLPKTCGTDSSGRIYKACNPDALSAASSDAFPVLRYGDSNLNAAIYYSGKGHKAASYGFPLETVAEKEDLMMILGDAIRFFSN